MFAASAANVKTIINLRPFVTIPDSLVSYKLMKSLNPEAVIPGHGAAGCPANQVHGYHVP